MAKFRRKRKNNAKILLILILAIIAIAIMLFFKTDMFRNQFYPKKYSEYVTEFSEKYNVDENFIYAVIKTESGFDCSAVSDVGARGLMQMMHDTFDWVQFRLDEQRDITYDDMFIPQHSIEYGTYMLSYLYEKYGSYELVAAAYHSGAGRVDSWISDGVIDPLNVVVDDIPSDITRHYINKIMNAYKSYKNLY